jgi:putative membrane protein
MKKSMSKYLWRWLVTSLAILMVPHLVSGVRVSGVGSALAVAAVLGLLNLLVKPLLIIVTLPLTVVTLGFFLLVLNAFLFQMAAWFVAGFEIDGFFSAFVSSLIVSFVSWFLSMSVNVKKVSVQRGQSRDVLDMERRNDGKWEKNE